jgi:rare lipoprotein A
VARVNASTYRHAHSGIAALLLAALFGCAQVARIRESEAPHPPVAAPQPAPPQPARSAPPEAAQRGAVSLYGPGFEGRKTASGEPFDPQAMTMAHRTLPFGTKVRVTNLENRRSVEVKVNDRGPFVEGRIADLSIGAAQRIGMVADGVVEAMLEVLERPRE